MSRSGMPVGDAEWEALARYVSGESPAAEADAVRAWLAADPARQEMVDALVQSMAGLAFRAPADLDVDAALAEAKARLAAESVAERARADGGRPAVLERVPARRLAAFGGWPGLALRAAAVVALVAAGAVLWQSGLRVGGGPESLADAQTFGTSIGERDSVWLPDGSRVLLGPASRLAVGAGYGGSRREVEMWGEAYFDVEPDGGRPFVVRVGGAAVQVVGTSFAVRGGGEEGVSVVVAAGAVRLRSVAEPEAGGVVLEAGDRGVLEVGGRALAERGAATEEDYAWRHGRLVFRDAPLDRVSAELMRWYGVEVRFEDPALAARRLTADFAGEPVREVLDVIALALGAEVVWRADTAVLRTPVDEVPAR